MLENGPSSAYAAFFDVDWEPPEHRIHNTVLMPVLEDQDGNPARGGKIEGRARGRRLRSAQRRQSVPGCAAILVQILAPAAQNSGSDALAFLGDGLDALPSPALTDLASITRRHRDKKLLAEMLAKLLNEDAFGRQCG